jgi:hypothetical protein
MKKRKNKEIVITLGKVPSLNSFYAGSHWTKRKKAKDAALEEIKSQLGFNENASYHSFRITAYVRYRYDLDNSIIAVKFCSDALKALGWIKDDSPKHFRYLLLVWQESIPTNTAKIAIELSDEYPQ